jgi:glycerol-3-phosphate acyltransferase PlsX
MHWMKDIFSKNPVRLTGAMLARSAFKELKEIGDAEELGGAPLLGIKGVCVIGHGSSTPKAVRNAIRVASDFVRLGINEKITSRIIETDMIANEETDKNLPVENIE